MRPQQCRRAALLKSHFNAGTNPQKHLRQEHPMYIQKSKLN